MIGQGGEVGGYFVHDGLKVPGFESPRGAVGEVHVGVFLAEGLEMREDFVVGEVRRAGGDDLSGRGGD